MNGAQGRGSGEGEGERWCRGPAGADSGVPRSVSQPRETDPVPEPVVRPGAASLLRPARLSRPEAAHRTDGSPAVRAALPPPTASQTGSADGVDRRPAPPTAVTGAGRCTWGAEGEGAVHRAPGPVARPPDAAKKARAGRDRRGPRAPSVREVFRSALTQGIRRGAPGGLVRPGHSLDRGSSDHRPILPATCDEWSARSVSVLLRTAQENLREPGWQGSGGGQPWWGAEWRD